MDDNVSYQFAPVRQRRDDRQNIRYELILRQQPKQSRMCGIGEKADRRPIDPPPIIQLKVYDDNLPQSEKNSFLQNPYFFMYASLVAPDTNEELHLLRDGKTRSTTGSVVSSLYHLKDVDNSDAGFFVFPDLSVRMEGTYRLKLSLFEIVARLVKRKELEQIEDADGNRMKRARGDGKYDDDSRESSETEITDRTRSIEDSHSRRSPELSERRRDHGRKSPPSSRHRGPYDPYSHYDHNAIYGHGYPLHRPLPPWHDRPEYMGDPHYAPYYDPYDRRYGYHPYYYPPPLLDGSDHHRYPYPPPPAYGRPPMYPGQPGYYDPPSRIPHPSSESSGAVRPYGYDPSNIYSPRPWHHYGDRTPTNHSTESMPSPYRGSGPVPLHGPPMYPYPDYYPVYPPPPMGPLHPPPKQDYGPGDPASSQHGQNPSKIPIQDLLSTEQHQSQSNAERGVAGVPPPRMYGAPPSAFAHFYPHPGRPHEYPPRHDLYGHPRYQHEMGYPSHESYATSSSSASAKAAHPSTVSQSQDSARSSTITSTQATMPPSTYSSGSIVPVISRPAASLPSLAPINVLDRYASSSSNVQTHTPYPTSSTHSSTTAQQKSPKQSTSQHSSYEQSQLPYSQSSLNSSNRMSFSPIAGSSNGKNKHITDCSSMNDDNEDSNSLSSPDTDLEESRRQDDDAEDD
ncbi:4375_t:CDS:2 [Cetraspora pellucida]|uniref:4375_t:CDS:1 n=1 Tax=Cetraspora pellucida TaxID=1433469 RepID=A0A9N9DC93_9GLOM|nr:4375_t:CDS:2 [Cetraspora pellucida]